jgi:hypothetical protein
MIRSKHINTEAPRKCRKGVSYQPCKSIATIVKAPTEEVAQPNIPRVVTKKKQQPVDQSNVPTSPPPSSDKSEKGYSVADVYKSIAKRNVLNAIKKLTEGTSLVRESMTQHKYAHMMNSSYNTYYEGIEDAHSRLNNVEHIPELKDFRVVSKLTDSSSTVLHNPKTGEVHIAYRGTDPTNVGDIGTDGAILVGAEQLTKRLRDAERKVFRVQYELGEVMRTLTVSGHSLGGNQSIHVAEMFNLVGYHYNPAVSFRQVYEDVTGRWRRNTSRQTIYRTVGDPVSANSMFNVNRRVEHVRNAEGMETALGSHKTDHFHTKPVSKSEGHFTVNKANYVHSAVSVVGGVLDAAAVGIAGYHAVEMGKQHVPPQTFENEMSQDLNPFGSAFNIDPEYQWTDETAPAPVQMMRDYILHHTSWGRERLKEDSANTGVRVEGHVGVKQEDGLPAGYHEDPTWYNSTPQSALPTITTFEGLTDELTNIGLALQDTMNESRK